MAARQPLRTRAGARIFYRVAASAHYEAEHHNPNHADVEICPICGRTGEYADLRGNAARWRAPRGREPLVSFLYTQKTGAPVYYPLPDHADGVAGRVTGHVRWPSPGSGRPGGGISPTE